MGRITAHTVSISPSHRSIITLGAMVTWKGRIIRIRIQKKIASRPRKVKRLRA